MTTHSTVENAVEAMKLGAFHYINKPFNVDEVALLVEKALEPSRLRREVKSLRTSVSREFGFESIVGNSSAMQAVKALLERIATSPASRMLLTGETGTGKDLEAKAVHYNSDRAAKGLREHHLLCTARAFARKRTLRARAGRVYRREAAEARLFEVADGAPCSSTKSAR
jgi:DNA-binding NtrC family response regulator